MSARQKKFYKVLSGTVLVFMLISGFFGWQSSRYSHAWHFAFYGFGLLGASLSLFVSYRFGGNVTAPDTLTRLFPKPTQESPESHKQ